ncbi:uncharacterized protein LOC123553849 [Mercenaria mercenaria]|uniref:uncharacterized protein LOC123553849 n=1 Tax=Mercenaria mercenaria TaxID=6596 RepID=UPI00234E5064|nr:uncharacterized protein LOC123553849 [Mercenaria mercenaria]
MTDTSQTPTSATSNQTSSNKPDYNEQSIEGPATPSTHTEPENGNTPVTETETSRPASLTRTPFRPVRPVQPSPQMNQTLTLLNVLTDQVRDLSKEVIESKKGQAAYNKRLTDIEATQAVIMSKLDILINQKQLQSSPVENCASHDTEEAPDIDDQYVLSESLLRTLRHEANNAQHFACLLLPHVFPELFSVDKLRVFYNWSGNAHGKQELDPARKAVVKKYTNLYYPETKNPTCWVQVVTRVNERLRRKDKLPKVQRQTENEGAQDFQTLENIRPLSDLGVSFTRYLNSV